MLELGCFNKSKVIVSDSYTGKIESYNRKQVEKIYNFKENKN